MTSRRPVKAVPDPVPGFSPDCCPVCGHRMAPRWAVAVVAVAVAVLLGVWLLALLWVGDWLWQALP